MKPFLIACAAASTIMAGGCSDGTDRMAPPVSLTAVPSATPEGAPGEMPPLRLRVTLTEPHALPVGVRYATSEGTATEGIDYLAASGELSIVPGALEAFIEIDIIGDAQEEPAETFTVDIEVSDNAVPTATQITATIANDDSACDAPFDSTDNPWRVFGADPLNFAHRGGVVDFPENTLFAYAEAAAGGADVLEMDVYQTRDNELVILHDLDVDRTTNGSGNVADLSLAELRELDAAYWFVPGEGTPRGRPADDYVFRGIATGDKPPPPGYSAEDFRIPTLEEALARFPHELINVELKPDLDGTGDYEVQMAELLQRYGRSTDLIAASFVDEAANNFKAAAPCVFTSIPLDQGTGLVFGFLGNGEFPAVPEHITWQVPPDTGQIGQVDIELEIVTPQFIAASHEVNLAVQVWTINTCQEMLRMIDLGVDAIMTDRPLLLAELLDTPPAQRRCN